MRNLMRRLFASSSLVREDQRLGELPDSRTAYKDVIMIALPAIAELVLMSLIGSADTIMVGQLGKTALAAVALPAQPRMMMLALFLRSTWGSRPLWPGARGKAVMRQPMPPCATPSCWASGCRLWWRVWPSRLPSR